MAAFAQILGGKLECDLAVKRNEGRAWRDALAEIVEVERMQAAEASMAKPFRFPLD